MCPIGLHDVIILGFGGGAVTCECNHSDVPSGPGNLAHRAAVLFLNHGKVGGKNSAEGVSISIDKHIPVGAGLGGGSSNAASVLCGLNRHFGRPLSREELISMGASLGADVPFFIFGGPAMASRIGEILNPPPAIRPFKVVLIYPGVAVSTAEVYKNLKLGLTNHEKENKKILFNGKVFDPPDHLHNDLEAVAESLCPSIRSAREALSAVGADGVLTSGSGSSVFGIFYDTGRAVAAAEALGRSHTGWQVLLADAMV
jgi:4-diphosphocytidyl-2-C-methyl-D-erythritol kinase